MFQKELQLGEIDIVSVTNPAIIVHECKYKVDGITKFVDNQGFQMDNTFGDQATTESLYSNSIQPQIDFLFDGGVVTCFAYGQTGSGKTYTMEGVQGHAVNDLFAGAEIMREDTGREFGFTISYFEIYGKLYDLLNNHAALNAQEDKSGQIIINGIHEAEPRSPQEMLQLIQYGSSVWQTHATASNDTSSRSHAICTIKIFETRTEGGRTKWVPSGKLLLVDLAGSEWAQDTQSNSKHRWQEGAEINQSLLALKECIWAMESKGEHIPFR